MVIDGNGKVNSVVSILLGLLITVIAWIGGNLIKQVEDLSSNFNQYAIRMENRVTVLEAIERSKRVQP